MSVVTLKLFNPLDVVLPRGDLERHRWVRRQLEALPRKARLLDLGCGPQPYRAICGHLEYRAQDFAQYEGKGGQGLHDKDWRYGKLDYVGNAWNVDEKDGAFDAVLCTEVLEHVPQPRATVLEIGRLLKSGGVAFVTAPINCLPHQNPYFFSHGLSREFYEEAAHAAGLTISSFETYSGALDFMLQEIYRLVRHGPWPLRPFAFVALLPLVIAKSLRLQATPYPCFGAFVVMKKE